MKRFEIRQCIGLPEFNGKFLIGVYEDDNGIGYLGKDYSIIRIYNPENAAENIACFNSELEAEDFLNKRG